VKTEFHEERRVAVRLEHADFEVYAPRSREILAGRGGRKIQRTEPVFSGYLFVRKDKDNERFRELVTTRGVLGALDGVLAHLEIQKIRAREDEDGFVVLFDRAEFEAGQRVRVRDERFEGLVGIYQGMTSDEKSKVLFRMLGSERSVIVSTQSLVAAPIAA
jgi:transcriptional antiterminator RfaH